MLSYIMYEKYRSSKVKVKNTSLTKLKKKTLWRNNLT